MANASKNMIRIVEHFYNVQIGIEKNQRSCAFFVAKTIRQSEKADPLFAYHY